MCRKYCEPVKLKLAQEKVWLGELPVMTIAVDWDVKQQNKQIKQEG